MRKQIFGSIDGVESRREILWFVTRSDKTHHRTLVPQIFFSRLELQNCQNFECNGCFCQSVRWWVLSDRITFACRFQSDSRTQLTQKILKKKVVLRDMTHTQDPFVLKRNTKITKRLSPKFEINCLECPKSSRNEDIRNSRERNAFLQISQTRKRMGVWNFQD